MFNLGALWERGIGVTADSGKARTWYQRAAAQNYPAAKAALTRLGT
jgi:TPR repeat protein